MSASGTTGRYLVLFNKDRLAEGSERLAEIAQVQVVHPSRSQTRHEALPSECAWVFDHIGVALLRCGPAAGQLLQRTASEPGSAILVIEPEREVHATNDTDEGRLQA